MSTDLPSGLEDVPELSAVEEHADLPLADAEILGSDVDSSRFIMSNPDITDGSVVDNQRELDLGGNRHHMVTRSKNGIRKTKIFDVQTSPQVVSGSNIGYGWKISRLELKELLLILCLGHEKSTAWKAAEGMIREMDLNNDGDIDLEEFMHAMVVSE
ncbi:hypothetical protein GQ457_08G022990 [Hibiscus cannabinus]